MLSRKILGISTGIGELVGIRWDLALCLLLCWIIVFACLYNGLKSMGKVFRSRLINNQKHHVFCYFQSSYFTALFPYVVLTILLVRCVLLPGASNGISFYVTPKWETLGHVHVWVR